MNTLKTLNVSLEVFGGLLSIVIILGMLFGRMWKERENQLFLRILICNIFLLISDASTWIWKGGADRFSHYAVRLSNFFVYMLGYLLLALFTDYLVEHVSRKGKISGTPARIMWILSLAAMALVVVSQFNHMYYRIDAQNRYRREDWFWLSQIWGIVCMFINAVVLIRAKNNLPKRERIMLAAYILLPILAMLIQIYVYGVALLYLATSISCLCIFMGIQVEQANRLREKERELERSRTELMLSQIRPHFLYNALTTIRYLCTTDPKEAGEAVSAFSGFLRANMDSLTCRETIPFEKELNHARNYLDLEKRRFGERLKVVYEIGVRDFRLPPLTLQPIVENAVRHGIMKRVNGGTVTIRTEEDRKNYRVIVKDDGPGYRPERTEGEDRPHLGMENVRDRLFTMCGGTLDITGISGGGTIVVISVPKAADKSSEREINIRKPK